MWETNKAVKRVYTTNDGQNGWADIDGVGWRKVKPGASDGVTNCFLLLTAAKANSRSVNVYIVSNLIERAYLN